MSILDSKLSGAINIADLRRAAKNRLPKVVFDYLDGGAEDEITLRENCSAFNQWRFRPRHAVVSNTCDLRATVMGTEIALPMILAPIGYSRLMHSEGEKAAARAAGNSGIVYILSTISGHKLEDVKLSTTGQVWYQLYLLGGREAAEGAIERARSAGYSALVVTIDTAVAGMRERDLRNGMKELMRQAWLPKVRHSRQFLTRPRWLAGFLLDGGLPSLPNVIVPGKGSLQLTDVGAALAASAVTWNDLRWIRDSWRGPIIIKGVMTPDDARRSMDNGAEAIVVSNHGGRQLDSLPATLNVLPEIAKAVSGRLEILMDGGIRRGSDIVKAICLGASAVLIGRAYAYGMASSGYAGVAHAIKVLQNETERTLRLLGCCSLRQLGPDFLTRS